MAIQAAIWAAKRAVGWAASEVVYLASLINQLAYSAQVGRIV